jgi:putative thioredoxin
LPAEHQTALAAVERGDWAAAQAAFRTALNNNPSDLAAKLGLARVELFQRVESIDGPGAAAAAERPDASLENVLDAADVEIAAERPQVAFDRLLARFQQSDAADREIIRRRLVSYFDVVGSDHPAVGPARRALAALLN